MNPLEKLKHEIEQRLPQELEPFAIFDFDNTCIAGDIGEAMWGYLIRTSGLDPAMSGRYDALIAEGKVREAYLLYSTIVAGMNEREVKEAARRAIEDEGAAMAVRPRVLELMEFLKKKGVAVWVISASHEPAVHAAMKHFGIRANLIGLRNTIEEGVYTSQLQKPASMFEGKVECVRTYIHKEQAPLLVIDDSPTGLPILETARIKVVVDHNQAFVHEAKQRGWFIL